MFFNWERGEQRPRPVGATIKLLKSIVEGEGDRARGKWNVSRTFLAYEMSTRYSFFSGRERRRIWILGCMLMQPCTRFQNCISLPLIEFLWKYIAPEEFEKEFARYLRLKNRNIVGFPFLDEKEKGSLRVKLARDNQATWYRDWNFRRTFKPSLSLMKIEL